MKNTFYLFLLAYSLTINNLDAQIELTAFSFRPSNPKIPPLSIKPISGVGFRISAAEMGISEINSKIDPLSIKPILGQNFQISSIKRPFFQTANAKLQTNNAFKLQTSKFKLIDFFEASDTFNKQRFWGFVGASTTFYVGTVLLLDKVWYAQYPREAFHLFDDSGEWEQMDKYGHVLTAYTETKWIYEAMRWTGMENRKAAWAGVATGTALQATLEILDGFSTEWGFSWSDMAANTAGCVLFGVQQAVWNEQRMVLKVSNTPRAYSTAPIRSTDGSKTSSLRERTNDLYGQGYAQTFFKDYNALTWWLSINPKSFNKNSRFPSWLNVAVGYGADNMFGGYVNEWPTKKPEFTVATDLPRYKQFYLSLDIDLSKVKTKSKFLNTVLKTINFVKIPAPALEFNTLGQVKFHPLFF